jgi:beta-glucosidase
MSGLLRL